MKKKVVALSAALMLFAGVVSASSINGDYKGNPIVKVTSSGKLLETDEVPAQIYDGHTVVPISLLRQVGASVTWDANTYSVDVKLPDQRVASAPVESGISNEFAYQVEIFRFLSIMNEQASLTSQISFLLGSAISADQVKQVQPLINKIATDTANNWGNRIVNFPISESDKKDLIDICIGLNLIKQSFDYGEFNTAHDNWMKYKNNLNTLMAKYDGLIQNQLLDKLQ